MTPEEQDRLDRIVLAPMVQALGKYDITMESLSKSLAEEMRANITKTAKLRGVVQEKEGAVRTVASSGVDGDTLLGWDEIDWSTRQRARMDAQKLLGVYPPEKRQISLDEGNLTLILELLPEDVRVCVVEALQQQIERK